MWLTKAHTSQEAPTSINGSSSLDSYSIDTELCDLLFETKIIYEKYT